MRSHVKNVVISLLRTDKAHRKNKNAKGEEGDDVTVKLHAVD